MDFIGLLPAVGGLATTILSFIVVISVIVAVHEYGHYIIGRWCGIKADVFSLGFGPILWSRHDKHGTRWQVAALPLGGYVKFKGDSNAASGMDAGAIDGLSPEERRQTMHGAPLWARASTVLAGPVFNFILSFFVFAGLMMVQGVASDPLTIDEVAAYPTEIDLQSGDQIIAVEGQPAPGPDEFNAFLDALPVAPMLDYTVLRDGREVTVTAPYPFPPIAAGITPNSAAADVDLEDGDVITAVDSDPIFTFEQLREKVVASDGRPLLLNVWRDGQDLEFTLVPRRVDLPTEGGGFETRWLIGISGGLIFTPAVEMPGPFEALSYGVSQTILIMQTSLSGLYHVVTGQISPKNISGPLQIAANSGAMAHEGVIDFIWWIAVISTAVGLLNLFPIPVLDGGHLVFHAWEALTGRPPSEKAFQYLMGVGLSLLLMLMVFALYNDVTTLFLS